MIQRQKGSKIEVLGIHSLIACAILILGKCLIDSLINSRRSRSRSCQVPPYQVGLAKTSIELLPKPRYLVFYSIFPFAISFANLSRCRVFLSRHPCVWNSLSRAFAENMWHKFPVFHSEVRIETFNSKHNGHRFAAVITVATCGLILHLVASSSFTSSSSTPPSNASSRSQWALPDLNRERQILVGTVRPRISVGTARHHKRQISVGTATLLSNGGGRPS